MEKIHILSAHFRQMPTNHAFTGTAPALHRHSTGTPSVLRYWPGSAFWRVARSPLENGMAEIGFPGPGFQTIPGRSGSFPGVLSSAFEGSNDERGDRVTIRRRHGAVKLMFWPIHAPLSAPRPGGQEVLSGSGESGRMPGRIPGRGLCRPFAPECELGHLTPFRIGSVSTT